MLKIGSLKLQSPLILAPMAGITDLPFRLLNRRFGAELAFVEMVDVRSLGHKSKKTHQMLKATSDDRPLGVQLVGKDEEHVLRALDILTKYEFDVLDFNSACPAKKVTKRGKGASLMREPEKLYTILKLLVDNVKVPVTVKIRAGWDKDSINAKDIALVAQDAGVSAIFIHGRTKEQMYSGSVDYEIIKRVKDALKVPVIASGDIFSAQLAKDMLQKTGCDGLAVARGSFGNPWIFGQINTFLKTGTIPPPPTVDEIARVMTEHMRAQVEFHGERTGVILFRKFFGFYTKGYPGIVSMRSKAFACKTVDDALAIIEEFRGTHGPR